MHVLSHPGHWSAHRKKDADVIYISKPVWEHVVKTQNNVHTSSLSLCITSWAPSSPELTIRVLSGKEQRLLISDYKSRWRLYEAQLGLLKLHRERTQCARVELSWMRWFSETRFKVNMSYGAENGEGAEWERSFLMCLLNATLWGVKALNLQYKKEDFKIKTFHFG